MNEVTHPADSRLRFIVALCWFFAWWLVGASTASAQTLRDYLDEKAQLEATQADLKARLDEMEAAAKTLPELKQRMAALQEQLAELREQRRLLAARRDSLEQSLGSYQRHLQGEAGRPEEVLLAGWPIRSVPGAQYRLHQLLYRHAQRTAEARNPLLRQECAEEGYRTLVAAWRDTPELVRWCGVLEAIDIDGDHVDVAVFADLEDAPLVLSNWYDEAHVAALSAACRDTLKRMQVGELVEVTAEVQLIHFCDLFASGPVALGEVDDISFDIDLNLAREFMPVHYDQDRFEKLRVAHRTETVDGKSVRVYREGSATARDTVVRKRGDFLQRSSAKFDSDRRDCLMVALVTFHDIVPLAADRIGRIPPPR